MTGSRKKADAAKAVREINKALGRDVLSLGSDPGHEVGVLPTGVVPIDVLLAGGLPRGRWTEIHGDSSTLKSYIALKAIATTQAHGGTCALFDTERAYDPEWAVHLGVDPGDLIVVPAPGKENVTGEHAADALIAVLYNTDVDLVVWDSVAATLVQEEHGKALADEKQRPARLAAFMSLFTRKVNAVLGDTAMLCLNQTRINVGQVFGDPTTTPGGRALEFYASHRIQLRRTKLIQREHKVLDAVGDQISAKKAYAIGVRATLVKSKLTKPHGTVHFAFSLEDGTVDDASFLLSQGVEHGVVTRKGSRWTLKGVGPRELSVVGKQSFVSALRQDPETMEAMRQWAVTTAQ